MLLTHQPLKPGLSMTSINRLTVGLLLASCLGACSDDPVPTPAADSGDLGPDLKKDVQDASSDDGTDLFVDAHPDLDPNLCPPDQRVESNQCIPCDPGKISPGQDDPTGPDTHCETLVCQADQYVESNRCVPCPHGQVNAPGDEATGPDTSCTDACLEKLGFSCGEFEDGYLKASNSAPFDRFGYSVAYHEGTLVVGATGEDSGGGVSQFDDLTPNSGAAYVFRRSDDVWIQDDYLKGSWPDNDDLFGSSVSIYGDKIAVGAPGEAGADTGVGGDVQNNDAPRSGAVFVFERRRLGWIRSAYIKASNTDPQDRFGIAVSLHEDTLAVGAHLEGSSSDVNGDDSGAAYIFTYDGTAWSQEAYLKASNSDVNDYFGRSIALHADTVAVGAPNERSVSTGVNGPEFNNDAYRAGAVYVFTRNAGIWSQQAYLKPSNTDAYFDFGSALDLQNDTLVVGAPFEPGIALDLPEPADRAESGAAYVFHRTGEVWTEEAYLKAHNAAVGHHFGQAVAVDGDRVAIGAPRESTNAIGLDPTSTNDDAPESGAVYLFDRSGSTWMPYAFVKASNTDSGDQFGNAIDLADGNLFVGAWLEDGSAQWIDGPQGDNGATDSGAVFVRKLSP